jgi:VWFA-related protein
LRNLNSSLLSLVSVFCCVAPLVAQTATAPGAQGPVPVFKANARAVVVDVVVTKGNNEPVRALRKQEFAVMEDGKPVSIDYFEEHTAKTLAPGALPGMPAMPPNVYTNVPPAPPSDAVNVLLLDSLNTSTDQFSYARKAVLAFLSNVKPGTRLAIITLNDKLNFVQGFTTDTALLAAAVRDRSKGGMSQSLISSGEVASNQETVAFLNSESPAGASPAGAGGSTTAAQDIEDAFTSYQNFKTANRTRMTLEAVSAIARYLAAVPGRKNLIWFSGDFPIVIFPKFDQRMEAQDNVISIQQIQKAADLLTAARVAVYPVFANGMMTEDILTAVNRSPSSAVNPTRMSAMANMDNYIASSGDRGALIAAMNQIASDTGGKATYNTNDLNAATLRAVSDGAEYYTLAYTPPNKKLDGHYRKVEVRVNDGKYKLSYRRGYNADEDAAFTPKGQDTDPLRPLLVKGMPSATELLFAARVVPSTPQPAPNATRAGKNPKFSGPFTRYTVDFMIRWTDVKFEPAAGNSHAGKIQVGLLAYDRNGIPVNWTGATQVMNLNPEIFAAIQKSGIPVHMEIDLPNTEVYLETGVYDWGSGKAGTLEIPLNAHDASVALAAQTAPKKN